jgi:hypothetical protein
MNKNFQLISLLCVLGILVLTIGEAYLLYHFFPDFITKWEGFELSMCNNKFRCLGVVGWLIPLNVIIMIGVSVGIVTRKNK